MVATNWLSYGENMWTTKLFGKWASMGIAGFAFGLASMPILGYFWGYLQAIISCIAFLLIKKWDDAGIIKNPFVELLRGGIGTIIFFVA